VVGESAPGHADLAFSGTCKWIKILDTQDIVCCVGFVTGQLGYSDLFLFLGEVRKRILNSPLDSKLV
jgi:hypothetical protein